MGNQHHDRPCRPGKWPASDCAGCQEEDRCQAFYWLGTWGFQKAGDAPENADYLVKPYLEAADEAVCRFPNLGDNGDHRKQGEKFIISRLNRAVDERARELRRGAREKRRLADEEERNALAVERSKPKGPGRFPYGWMMDIAKGYRGARELMHLLMLIKEIAKKRTSDALLDGLVGTGKLKREWLYEYYDDKFGNERSRPAMLFQMDYELAFTARGWKRKKTSRLLKKAVEAEILQAMGKLPPENGQMVYCAGVWITMDGKTWPKWNFKGSGEQWIKTFLEFRCT